MAAGIGHPSRTGRRGASVTRPDARASSGSIPARSPLPANVERRPLRTGRPRAARLRRRPKAPRHVESRHGASCAWPQRRRGVAHHPRLRQLRRHRLGAGVLRRGRNEAEAMPDGSAFDAGINVFDTANAYGGGRSESFDRPLASAKGPAVRERIVLATKTFNPMAEGEDSGLSRERIKRQIETSLARLGVTAYLCTSVTPWIRMSPSPRRSARLRSSPTKARSRPTAAATSTPPGSRKHSVTAVQAGRRTPTPYSNARMRSRRSESASAKVSATRRTARLQAAG